MLSMETRLRLQLLCYHKPLQQPEGSHPCAPRLGLQTCLTDRLRRARLMGGGLGKKPGGEHSLPFEDFSEDPDFLNIILEQIMRARP